MNCPKDNSDMFMMRWTPNGYLYHCRECGYQSIGGDKKLEYEQMDDKMEIRN